MDRKEISHAGVVLEVTAEYTTVQILSESACASCHASQLCGMGESREKIIQVPNRPSDRYEVGEQVYVNMRTSLGHKAVWLAYVAPLALLLAVFFTASALGAVEVVCGLVGIGAVALWYVVLYLLRDVLGNECDFYIKPKE